MLSPRYHHVLWMSLSITLVCVVPSYARGGGGGHARRVEVNGNGRGENIQSRIQGGRGQFGGHSNQLNSEARVISLQGQGGIRSSGSNLRSQTLKEYNWGSKSGSGSSSGASSKISASATTGTPGTGNNRVPIGQVTSPSAAPPIAFPVAGYVAPTNTNSTLASNRYALNSLGASPLGVTPPVPTVIPGLGGTNNGTTNSTPINGGVAVEP